MLRSTWRSLIACGLVFCALSLVPAGTARAETPEQRAARSVARHHWESIVIWYGDEDTGEWSLRIRDQDVKERAWFEFLELWQFDRAEMKWVQLKADKLAKAIVLPKQKGSDQPTDNQTLVELREIEPRTAGLWYAKWKVDEVPCSTLMRVGTGRAANKVEGAADPKIGTVKMVVPVDLNRSEAMIIPDPQIYCVAGGPGKPAPGEKAGR